MRLRQAAALTWCLQSAVSNVLSQSYVGDSRKVPLQCSGGLLEGRGHLGSLFLLSFLPGLPLLGFVECIFKFYKSLQ